jgi:D-arabinose 1-dehydrogenase-like Zn-dependent alcohol dehydrogenase
MPNMRAMQISEAGGDFESVEREIPEPQSNQVLIKVEACGICHSDAFVKEGAFPGLQFPRVPGHEIAGRIESVGEDVSAWSPGERVGVGWHGGHCFHCESCRRGDFVTCENAQICGISYDGGYAEYVVVPQEAVAAIPDELSSVDAAPLLCAGITTYNALRNSGARPGDMVAVQGVGGLGHLGIQYAAGMGFHTIALSRGGDKKELALALGAKEYIDTEAGNPAQALQQRGGARVILATAPSAKAMSSVIDGLAVSGKLLMIGATPEPIEVSPFQLIMKRRSITGWPSGTPRDSEDTLAFSVLSNTRAQIETYLLEEAGNAYERMISNKARFRVVLTMQ